MSEIRALDVAHMTIVSIIVLNFAVLGILAIRAALSRRTFFYVQILSNNQCIQVRLAQLPNSTRYTVVRIPREPMTIAVSFYYIIGTLSLTSRAPKIRNTLTGQSTLLPKTIIISPWRALQIQSMIQGGDYSVEPFLAHTHQYVFMNRSMPHTAPAYV
jgi:hypothetical protein